MGFFDSLWEGIKEGGKFIVDHAGDILTAGKSIAKVAGLGLTEENEVNIVAQSDTVLKLFDDYAKATNKLEEKAHLKVKTLPDPTSIQAMVEPVKTTGALSGTWTNPVAITEAGKNGAKNLDTYQDLSKFLTLLGAPASFVTKSRQVEDTAQLVAQALFANAPVEQLAHEIDDFDDPVTTTDLVLEDKHNQTVIKAAHSYYEIPMGSHTPKSIWHGALDVNVIRSQASCMAEIALRGETTYQAERQSATEGTAWKTALNIGWGDRWAADTGVQNTRTEIQGRSKSRYSLLTNSATGNTQIVRLEGPPGKTPADAKVFMVDVVRSILRSDGEQPAVMPQISVTTALLA